MVGHRALPTTGPAHQLLGRIRAEYAEMPGLSLTADQAKRLFGMLDAERTICQALLERLVDEGFLARTRAGQYRLRSAS
jgi:hypothetical protein